MTVFPANIERWRSTVGVALQDVLAENPGRKSLIDRLGVTISALTDILLALIWKESSGNPNAVGDAACSHGLMQLNKCAGTPQGMGWNGIDSLYDPYLNIYLGSKYLLTQLARYEDVNKAILSYNAGSYRTTHAGVPINQAYLDGVLSILKVPIDYFAKLSTKKNFSSESSPSSASTLSSEPEAGKPAGYHTLTIAGIGTLIAVGAAILRFCGP